VLKKNNPLLNEPCIRMDPLLTDLLTNQSAGAYGWGRNRSASVRAETGRQGQSKELISSRIFQCPGEERPISTRFNWTQRRELVVEAHFSLAGRARRRKRGS
jgi:hypothetical protein